MNICVIGNNLTSLVLSKALVNKKINVSIFYNYEKKTLILLFIKAFANVRLIRPSPIKHIFINKI